MPEIITGQDGSLSYETGAASEESAKVEAARAELLDEASGEASGELILGKYRSTEDLAEAYKSLQAEYTRLKSGQDSAPSPEPIQEEAPEGTVEEDQDEPDNGGTQLDPETLDAIRTSVLEQAGGEENYKRLATWVAGNLPAERVNSWNEALANGDKTQIVSVLKGLQYDYMMANGYEPRLTGGRAPSNEVRGFSSEAQVIEAMNDPRYSGSNPDPTYIKEVERRLAVSNVFQSR